MFPALILPLLATSCLSSDDDNNDYTQWNEKNNAWVAEQEQKTNEDGTPYYKRIVPVWAPGTYVLMHWHKRAAEETRVVPMSNSTVDVKYEGKLLDGTVFDSSYTNVQYGDSIARFKPSSTVAGFHTALVNMAPGDSVTIVIPSNGAYGVSGTGSVKPYSALEFDVMMKSIVYFEAKP